jgi:hypothetical protein
MMAKCIDQNLQLWANDDQKWNLMGDSQNQKMVPTIADSPEERKENG